MRVVAMTENQITATEKINRNADCRGPRSYRTSANNGQQMYEWNEAGRGHHVSF